MENEFVDEKITHDNLPQAVSCLISDLQKVIRLVSRLTPSSSQDSDKLLTIKQAAELINLAVPSVYGLVHRKMIPCMKRNKRLYFSEDELRNWIKSGRKSTIQEIKEAAAESLYTTHNSERGKK